MGAIFLNKINYSAGGGGQTIQIDSMPTAASSETGKIYQYIGSTTQDYIHGAFYECIEDSSTSPSTYSWIPVSVDASTTFIKTTEKGSASGVAELNSFGKVPSSQLPSYVDDVIEGYYDLTTDRFYEEAGFITVITPEAGKIWVDLSTNKSYRWTGSVYTRVDEGVQLGETSDSAYRGDRGKSAYDHSQIVTGNPHGTKYEDLDNVSVIVQTLTAGSTSLTFTDSNITSNSIFNIYTNVFGIAPSSATQSNNSLTLNFEAQSIDIDVKLITIN